MYNIPYELETLFIGLYVNMGLILIVNKVKCYALQVFIDNKYWGVPRLTYRMQ